MQNPSITPGFDTFSSNIAADINGTEQNAINPFVFDLKLTQWTCIPCFMMLLISSVLILYIVFKKYRAVLNVYFSVLFYIFCQIQFLIVTAVSWISESTRNDTGLTDDQFEQRCKIIMPFQTYSIILPGYAVLMMTLVRTIFVSRPLSYFDYIRRRYQVFGAGLSVILCGIISCLPSIGVFCHIHHRRICIATPSPTEDLQESTEHRYCSYDGKSCILYFALLVGLGSVPVIVVSCLYIYIYKLTVTAKKAHETLTKSQSSQQKSENSARNEDVRKENKKISKERRIVPWSILAILGVFVSASTPWILLEVMKDEIIDLVIRREAGALMFDVFYALVQFFVGISVLVYLLTTTSLRSASFQLIKTCFKMRNAA